MRLPIIVINFKDYESGTGSRAVAMARMCDMVARKTDASIAIAVQATDVFACASAVRIPVFGQHAEGYTFGAHTGHVLPAALKAAGAIGTLLNHSEDQYASDALSAAVTQCKKDGLFTIVCASTPQQAGAIAQLSPDMIAIEPPELIGKGVSVSTTKPQVISNTITAVGGATPVLCGAGISAAVDVRKALELGTVGVLLASGVMNAADPQATLLDLIEGLKSVQNIRSH